MRTILFIDIHTHADVKLYSCDVICNEESYVCW